MLDAEADGIRDIRSWGEPLTIRADYAHSLDESERARHRLVLDLHDGPVQSLSAAHLRLEVLASQLENEQSRSEVDRIRELLQQASDDIYAIARKLGPVLLDDTDLADALGEHIAEFEKRTQVRVDLVVDGAVDEYSTSAKVATFRVIQEALTNAHRHGGAVACRVLIRATNEALECTVDDDGCGFDTGQTLQANTDEGLGLRGMAERAALLDGDLTVASAPGAGTRVSMRIPRWLQ